MIDNKMFVENIIKIVPVEQKVKSYLLFVFLPILKNPTESSFVFIYFSFLGEIVELNLSLSVLVYSSSLYVCFFFFLPILCYLFLWQYQ